jgi:hypothetical protein
MVNVSGYYAVRRLFAGFSSQSYGFDLIVDYVGFMVDRVALGNVFILVSSSFPL